MHIPPMPPVPLQRTALPGRHLAEFSHCSGLRVSQVPLQSLEPGRYAVSRRGANSIWPPVANIGCSVQQSWISLGDFAAGVSDAFYDSISVSCCSGFGFVHLIWWPYIPSLAWWPTSRSPARLMDRSSMEAFACMGRGYLYISIHHTVLHALELYSELTAW